MNYDVWYLEVVLYKKTLLSGVCIIPKGVVCISLVILKSNKALY